MDGALRRAEEGGGTGRRVRPPRPAGRPRALAGLRRLLGVAGRELARPVEAAASVLALLRLAGLRGACLVALFLLHPVLILLGLMIFLLWLGSP